MVDLGRYKFLAKIGRGGMAEVFLAKISGAAGFQKTVAVKRLLPHLLDDEEIVRMFIDEARLVSVLDHPNIVQVLDFDTFEGNYFFIMEYVQGRSLSSLMKACKNNERVLPPGLATYILAEAANGLAYAHEKKDTEGKPLNIVHRDISPQNILISTEGIVKVADFGIAKAATSTSVTRTGFLKGKMRFMSPEQVWGRAADHRSDIFALGVVAYEMCTGQRLFLGATDLEVLQNIREWPGLVQDRRPKHFSDGLWKIIAKCLEPDPKNRYQSAHKIVTATEDLRMENSFRQGRTAMASFLIDLFGDDLSTPHTSGQMLSLSALSDGRRSDRVSPDIAATDGSGISISVALPSRTSAIPSGNKRRRNAFLAVLAALFVGAMAATVIALWPSMLDQGTRERQPVDGGSPYSAGMHAAGDLPAVVAQDGGAQSSAVSNAMDAKKVSSDGAAQHLAAGGKTDTPQGKDKLPSKEIIRKRASSRVRIGTLLLNSNPWCYVEVDGKRLKKPTPIKIRLRAGKHVLKLSNPYQKGSKTIEVKIVPGKTLKKLVRL